LAAGACALFLVLLAGACGKHDNPTDNGTPPSVTIQTPDNGDSLSGVGFTVSGIASDEEGIASIELRADGSIVGVASSSPFSFFFPALLYDAGTTVIEVEAEDIEGAKGSATVTIAIRTTSLRAIGSGSDNDRDPSWSPDGERIAYASEGTGGTRDIYAIQVDAGAPEQLTTSTNEDIAPDWSPLGDRIAFASNRSGNWDIWTVPADGGVEIQVTTNGSVDRGPAWAPSGMRLAWHTNRDASWNLYSVGVSSGAATGEETAYTTAATAESSATWRADGDALAFASNQLGGSDIWTVEPPDPILVAVAGANDPLVREVEPDFSAKGKVLLFVDNRNGNYDIWALDLLSGRKKVLASHLMADREPAWSRQGDRIAFSSNRGGTYDIWILE
jgi:Tol biopolymer transport system component